MSLSSCGTPPALRAPSAPLACSLRPSSVVVEWGLLTVEIMLCRDGGDIKEIAKCGVGGELLADVAVALLSLPWIVVQQSELAQVAQGIFFFATSLSVNFQAKKSFNQRTKCCIHHHRFAIFCQSTRDREGCRGGLEDLTCVCALHCTVVHLHAAQNKGTLHAAMRRCWMFRVSRCTLPSTRNLDVPDDMT